MIMFLTGNYLQENMKARPFNGENCVSDYKRAPRLGEHTVEALKSVGYSDEEIKKLADDKKIFIEEK